MAELTIAVDNGTLKDARMRTLEEGTSVNALLRGYLEGYTGRGREEVEVARRIVATSRESVFDSGPGGRE